MLQSLHIENMAVIRRLDVDFEKGFTVLTGETGAGKSIIVDSLKLLLGAKLERDMIRHGESTAEVSVLFGDLAASVCEALADADVFPDEDGCLSMTRVFKDDGKSTARVNGKTVSLAVFREAMQYLLHIHGQEDTSFLKREGSELAVLDSAAHNEEEREAYRISFASLQECKRQLERLSMDEHEKRRTLENLRYQIADIEEVMPQVGEEERLFDEKIKLKNIAKIAKQTNFAYRALYGAEKGNACYIIDRAVSALEAVADVLPEAQTLSSRLEEQLALLRDIAEEVNSLADFEGDDPEAALERTESRLAAIASLTRKYGGNEEAVLTYLAEAKERLAAIESMEFDRKKCEAEYEKLYAQALRCAEALHETRRKAAQGLCDEINEMLHALDMPSADFAVSLQPRFENGTYTFKNTGYEDVVFMIRINPGEPCVPVTKSASGGELSRIMLAIKSVIARHDGMPTVVFDEVDTGVSGKTSRKIGYTFRRSAEKTQILCVTHSAQIASLAETHLFVYKEERDGRTHSALKTLSEDERVEELARILGGLNVTEAQRQAAKDMLAMREE